MEINISTYFDGAFSTKLRPKDQTISSMGYQINQVVWTFLKKRILRNGAQSLASLIFTVELLFSLLSHRTLLESG